MTKLLDKLGNFFKLPGFVWAVPLEVTILTENMCIHRRKV